MFFWHHCSEFLRRKGASLPPFVPPQVIFSARVRGPAAAGPPTSRELDVDRSREDADRRSASTEGVRGRTEGMIKQIV